MSTFKVMKARLLRVVYAFEAYRRLFFSTATTSRWRGSSESNRCKLSNKVLPYSAAGAATPFARCLALNREPTLASPSWLSSLQYGDSSIVVGSPSLGVVAIPDAVDGENDLGIFRVALDAFAQLRHMLVEGA